MVFFVIEIKTRAVEIAGIQVDPAGEWMKQIARNLTDPVNGFLRGAKYLIHDRDPLFTEAADILLSHVGIGRRCLWHDGPGTLRRREFAMRGVRKLIL